jgi:hypothetical protein
MTPDMGPYIAAAWLLSLAVLGGYAAYVIWRFQGRER